MRMKTRMVFYVVLLSLMTLLGSIADAESHSEDKRYINVLHNRALSMATQRRLFNNIVQSLTRVRRNHRYMTDAGYGSRVQAASKIAKALIAQHDIFGTFGPGRRKRPSGDAFVESA